MTVTTITSFQQFQEIINSGSLVAIDFWAKWCGPCKMISPHFDRLSNEIPNMQFYKVDVDDQPEVAQECNIRAMPTFLIFQNGQKIGDIVGANQDGLTNLIQNSLNAS